MGSRSSDVQGYFSNSETYVHRINSRKRMVLRQFMAVIKVDKWTC